MTDQDIVARLRQQQAGMLRKGEFAFVNRTDITALLEMFDALRANLEDAQQVVNPLMEQISELRRERDEARRMYCGSIADDVKPYRTPDDIAADRGWDCFDKIRQPIVQKESEAQVLRRLAIEAELRKAMYDSEG